MYKLHKAAYYDSVERVVALLSRGSIDINHEDPTGCTPLMISAKQGHTRVTRILINRGTYLFKVNNICHSACTLASSAVTYR